MAQITCPNCGKQLPEDAKNCPYCGYAIPTEGNASEKVDNKPESKQEEVRVKEIWVCPDCGFEMTDEKESCPNCACPKSFFEHKQVNEIISLKTETDDVKGKNPKWITFLVLALVVIAGITIANGVVKQKKYEAAQEAAREAEYQRRVEEEQRQKRQKEKRINNLKNIISGNTYSISKSSLYSYSTRNEFNYSFKSNGSGTWKFYEVSAFGYDLKYSGTIRWWIDDEERLVVKDNEGNTDYFSIHSGYIEHNNGDKFYREY